MGVYVLDEGAPIGTGTWFNFRGENVEATISGTVVDVFITGSSGGGGHETGTVVIYNEDTFLGVFEEMRFKGAGVDAYNSGTYAAISIDPQKTFALNFIVGSGQAALPTGSVGAVELGVSGTIDYLRLYADRTGTALITLRIGPWDNLPLSDAFNRFGGEMVNLRKKEFSNQAEWSGSYFGRGDWLEVIIPTGTVFQLTAALGGRLD
jgi:hypothetical protein